jgi:hypothetical protein
LSNIVSIKTTGSVFLAIVLITGTIAISSPSSMLTGAAQAQQYYDSGMDNSYNSYGSDYGMDNYDNKKSYDKKPYGNENDYGYESQYQPSYKPNYKPTEYPSYFGKDNNYYKSQKDSNNKKSITLNKIKCINDNININGNNTGNISIDNNGAAEEGYVGVYSSNGGGYDGSEGYYDDGYDNKRSKSFDCIINNNNTNTNIGGGSGNQTVPGNQTTPPEPTTTTLNVTKLVTCEESEEEDSILSVQQANGPTCAQLEALITEDQFNIQVTGSNPVPSSFNGSEAGTLVTLDAGGYTVRDGPSLSVFLDKSALGGNITGPIPSFTGNCIQTGNINQATGNIAAGQSQTCNIINQFVIEEDDTDFTVASSPIIAQGIEDSPELTASEKIAKLKQQWLDLLP